MHVGRRGPIEPYSHHRIEAMTRYAAFCYEGESVEIPLKYNDNNVTNTLKLLDSMLSNDFNKFFFSPSCATCGEPEKVPITERHPQNPINHYGRTKLIVEKIL
ncbi:MAG: NAD-dependent epimerase/dehydratase family protein [Nitrospinales bacterium]